MIQYFTEILKTFSTAQRIWALIILCISVFFITFGSNIIDAIKPDPTQQNLVVKRQRNVITSLNTQLDSLTLRVDDLTQEVIDGQSECTRRRIDREKEIIAQIDEIEGMVRGNARRQQLVRRAVQNSQKSEVDSVRVMRDENAYEVYDDNSGQIIEGLCNLKKKIKNKK
jgi:hypothetical protein